MHTEHSGNGNHQAGNGQGESQSGGAITDMLRGTVSGLGENLRSIARGEIELAKAELREEASQVGRAGGMIAGGGVLGLTGFMFLMTGLMHLLARKMPLWAAASLVGSALVAIAGTLGMSGKNQLQESQVKPEQTIESLKDVKDSISNAPHQ